MTRKAWVNGIVLTLTVWGIIWGGAIAGCSMQQATSTTNSAQAADQLFCGLATTTGPLVVALLDIAGVPISVTGRSSAAIANACAAIPAAGNPTASAGAVPVAPPPNPAAPPNVAVAITAPPIVVAPK